MRESRPVVPRDQHLWPALSRTLFLSPQVYRGPRARPHRNGPPTAAHSLKMAPAQCSHVHGLIDRTSVHLAHAPQVLLSYLLQARSCQLWKGTVLPFQVGATFKGRVQSTEMKTALEGSLDPAVGHSDTAHDQNRQGRQGLRPRGSRQEPEHSFVSAGGRPHGKVRVLEGSLQPQPNWLPEFQFSGAALPY